MSIFNDVKGGFKDAFSKDNINSTIGGIADIIPTSPTGNTTNFSPYIDTASDVVGAIPVFGGIAKGVLKGVNALTNMAFGSNVNQEAVNNLKNNISGVSQATNVAGDFDTLASTSKSLNNIDILGADLGTQGWFNRDVDNARDSLLAQQTNAQRGLSYATDRINMDTINNLSRLTASFGGKLPLKKEEILYNSRILSNKDKYSNDKVEKALEYMNSFKEGGFIFEDYPKNITFIDNGGTHEENKLGGVPMGIAPDGQPNLVEEGEVIWNGYVFSNRLKTQEGKTFADKAKEYISYLEEMPNDKIANTSTNTHLSELMMEQEQLRQRKEMNKVKRTIKEMAKGGHLFGDGTWLDRKMNRYNAKLDRQAQLNTNTNNTNTNNNYLRYANLLAPVANMIENRLDRYKPQTIQPSLIPNIGYSPVGERVQYTPFDMDYYANNLRSAQAGTIEAMKNRTNPSSLLGILAADYNAGQQYGALARQGMEQNEARKATTIQANNNLALQNAQLGLHANQINTGINEANVRNNMMSNQFNSQLNYQDKIARDSAISQNRSAFFDSLSGIGRENTDWDRLLPLVDKLGLPGAIALMNWGRR